MWCLDSCCSSLQNPKRENPIVKWCSRRRKKRTEKQKDFLLFSALQKPQEVGFSFCKNWMRRKLGFSFGFLAEEQMGFFLLQKLEEEENTKCVFFFCKKLEEEEDKMGFFFCKNWKRRRIKIAEKRETIIKTGKSKTQATKKKGKTHVQTAPVMTEICYRKKETVAEGSLAAQEEEDVKNQFLHNPVTTVATWS